jgi:hypothetical protein
MISDDTAEKAEAFWTWFAENEARIRQIRTAGVPLIRLVHAKLREIAPKLTIELSADDNPKELIISASGDRSLFPLVREVVSRAPKLPGWRFIALKPPRGFPQQTRFGESVHRPAEMWFIPLRKEGAPSFLGLRIGYPWYGSTHAKVERNGVYEVLEAALGEETLSGEVQYVEVAPLPDNPEDAGWGRLHELPMFLRNQKKSAGC